MCVYIYIGYIYIYISIYLINVIRYIIKALGDKKKLRSLVPNPDILPTLQLPIQPEPTARQRYLEYKRIYGRRRGG